MNKQQFFARNEYSTTVSESGEEITNLKTTAKK
jgi:hypothetical protein